MAKVSKKKNSRFVFWVQLALAGVLILVMVGTISGGLLQLGRNDRTVSRTPNFPPWLAGLRIQNYVTGNEARKRMEPLTDEFGVIKDSWLAFYENKGVIWIGQASDENEAQRLLAKLRTYIESFVITEGGAEFKESVKNGMTMYMMTYKDLPSEYVYRNGDKIFWVTLPSTRGDVFFDEVLSTFK